MVGNRVFPISSIGTLPLKLRRSSSTHWGKRERFATTSTVSSSNRRMKASTFAFSGERNSMLPRPNAWNLLRSAIRRFIHQSSEFGLPCCASTFNDS